MEDMKTAMRAHDSMTLNAIRYLLSQIKNVEIDNGPQDDAGIQEIIRKQVKQMKDALVDFQKGGREDIVAEEQLKIAIFEKYLPAQMSDEELTTLVAAVRSEHAELPLGQVIGLVKERAQGQADGTRVAAAVKQSFGV
jgi:uncharacterized protein YqeY